MAIQYYCNMQDARVQSRELVLCACARNVAYAHALLCIYSTNSNGMHKEQVVPNHMHSSVTCTSSAEGGRTLTEWLTVNIKERGRSTL